MRDTVILDDDDIRFVENKRGKDVAQISLDPGNKHVIWNGTYQSDDVPLTILFQGGDEGSTFAKGIFASNPHKVYMSNEGAGRDFNGVIYFANGDRINSGPGNAIYDGPHGRNDGPPAEIWLDFENDVLVKPADDVRAGRFDLGPRHVQRDGDIEAQVNSLMLQFKNDDPFGNSKVLLNLNDATDDHRNPVMIEYDGTKAGAREAINDLVDSWHDGRGFDPLDIG